MLLCSILNQGKLRHQGFVSQPKLQQMGTAPPSNNYNLENVIIIIIIIIIIIYYYYY